MSNAIALLAGDWHEMKHAWVGRKTLCGDAEYGLWQLTRIAKRHDLPIIAAGDQFDSMAPDRGIMIRAAEFVADVGGCYIQGNHDKVSPSWMELVARHWTHLEQHSIDLRTGTATSVELEHLFSKQEIPPLFDRDRTWHIHGIDYQLSADRLRERLDALEPIIHPADPDIARLLVLHQSVPPWTPPFACELLDGMVPDGFDLVLVGHVHDPRVASIRNKVGRPVPIVSPGGLHLLDVTENPRKKIRLLRADGSVRSMPLASRHRRDVDLRGLDATQLHEAVQALRESLAGLKPRAKAIAVPIVYAVCDDSAGAALTRLLESELGETAHLFVKTESEHDKAVQGIETVRMEDIDVRRHAEDGFDYAKEVIERNEPDTDVRTIVETILTGELDTDLYANLKTEFQEKHHAQDQASHAGELLPA